MSIPSSGVTAAE
jgi:hypothetical protein